MDDVAGTSQRQDRRSPLRDGVLKCRQLLNEKAVYRYSAILDHKPLAIFGPHTVHRLGTAIQTFRAAFVVSKLWKCLIPKRSDSTGKVHLDSRVEPG